jgi:hypothetical protein
MSSKLPAPPPGRRQAALFSTPLELGLRALIVLDAIRPATANLQRLVAYDYLLVHSGDAGGPESLHPSTPHRSGEILVKRDILRAGLQLLLSRGLVGLEMTPGGLHYGATDLASPFLGYFDAAYVLRLRERATWLRERFTPFKDEALQSMLNENLDRWGGEFTSEALVRNVTI